MSQVIFITGRAGAGKTTLAKNLAEAISGGAIVLDSDEIRKIYPTGFSDTERLHHILRMAELAEKFRARGFLVIIAAIMPKKLWRKAARKRVAESALVYVPGGTMWEGTEYEEPDEEEGAFKGVKHA
jgi:adenylylsulfate kinase-like enzyme